MSEPAKKQRNTNGPLPPATCADRIAKILADAPSRMAIAEAVVADTKQSIVNEITRLMQRNTVPESLRDLLIALKVDKDVARRFGMVLDDVQPVAASVQDDDDCANDIPSALREPVPPATGRIEVNREAPRVGARRQ